MCDRLDFWRYSSMLAEGEIVKAKIVCRTSLYRIFRLYIYKQKRWTQKNLTKRKHGFSYLFCYLPYHKYIKLGSHPIIPH